MISSFLPKDVYKNLMQAYSIRPPYAKLDLMDNIAGASKQDIARNYAALNLQRADVKQIAGLIFGEAKLQDRSELCTILDQTVQRFALAGKHLNKAFLEPRISLMTLASNRLLPPNLGPNIIAGGVKPQSISSRVFNRSLDRLQPEDLQQLQLKERSRTELAVAGVVFQVVQKNNPVARPAPVSHLVHLPRGRPGGAVGSSRDNA